MKKNEILEYKKKIYDAKGWAKFENLFSTKEVNIIKKKINSFLKKNHKKYSGRDVNYTDNDKNWKKINSFHKLHDFNFIKNFSKKNKILDLVKMLIKTKKIKLRAAELFAKPSKIGLKSPAHQDNFYWCIKKPKALTMWIALEKSNKSNGGVFYYNGSHKLGLLEHVSSNNKVSSQKIKNLKKLKQLKKIFPTLNVGDCLVHDSLVVHGSNKNVSSKSRKGLTFQFTDKFFQIDKKRKAQYLQSLKNQINERSFN
jgi:phytanoyl-CoA hydroxylase